MFTILRFLILYQTVQSVIDIGLLHELDHIILNHQEEIAQLQIVAFVLLLLQSYYKIVPEKVYETTYYSKIVTSRLFVPISNYFEFVLQIQVQYKRYFGG